MIEIVEQPPYVELHHPVLVPAPASGDGDRFQRRFSRPIAIGIVVEERIKPWLQPHLDRRVRDSVGYRRDAQHPHAPRTSSESARPSPAAENSCRNSSDSKACIGRRRASSRTARSSPRRSLRLPDWLSLATMLPRPVSWECRRFAGHERFLPVVRLISHAHWMTPSLRSSAVTVVSTLLRTAPSLGSASLLSASLLGLGPFAWHRRRRFQQFNARA